MKKGTLDLAIRDLSFVINRQPDHVESLYSRGILPFLFVCRCRKINSNSEQHISIYRHDILKDGQTRVSYSRPDFGTKTKS
jgi:hypothetical protein